MKKRRFTAVLALLVLLLCFPGLTAQADTGPKPSVRTNIRGIEGQECYGTLLAEQSGDGPYGSPSEGEPYTRGTIPLHDGGERIWRVFKTYAETDDFYYWEKNFNCRSGELVWEGYAPETFKLLLYFPETEEFMVSGPYTQYAFSSYFTVDAEDVNADGMLTLRRSYGYAWELCSLLFRMALTVAIELKVLQWFDIYKKDRLVSTVMRTNIATQLGLNLALNLLPMAEGYIQYTLGYLALEAAVLVTEAMIYHWRMNKQLKLGIHFKPIAKYALAANTASFAAGFVLSKLVPRMF